MGQTSPTPRATAIFQSLKHARAITIVALAAAIGSATWAAANFLAGTTFVAIENLAVAGLYLSAYFFNRAGRPKAAAMLVVVVFFGHMTFATIAFGYASGTHHFFLLGTVLPYMLFSREDSGVAHVIAVFSAATYLFCVAFQHSIPGILVVGSLLQMEIGNAVFLLVVLGATTGFFVSAMRQGEDALEAEHARSESLLYNLLPNEIATRLKDAPGKTIADNLDHTAILFADIVGFTPRSAQMAPEELVEFLNRIFSTFDTLAEKHGLEKIKTIGDAYMVAAGLPQPVDKPVHRVAAMACDMLTAMQTFSKEIGDTVEVRIGIHTGPVVAGVIGHQKLFYDAWGDTVNTASRMESHGQAGRIQVTAAARDALKDDYVFEPRGSIEIKGIGALETWWLSPKT